MIPVQKYRKYLVIPGPHQLTQIEILPDNIVIKQIAVPVSHGPRRPGPAVMLTVVNVGPRVVSLDGVLGRMQHRESEHYVGAVLRVDLRRRILALTASEMFEKC